jgi:hypothetical protein
VLEGGHRCVRRGGSDGEPVGTIESEWLIHTGWSPRTSRLGALVAVS